MENKNLNNIKNSGFKVPKDYFMDLEDSILTQAKLDSVSKESGFKTPENYFETLENRLLDSVKVSAKKESKVISIFKRKTILYATSIAAAVLLVFNLNFGSETTTIGSLDTETIDNYILDNTNSNDLASLFLEDELNEIQFIEYNFTDDLIDSYLESEDVNELILE